MEAESELVDESTDGSRKHPLIELQLSGMGAGADGAVFLRTANKLTYELIFRSYKLRINISFNEILIRTNEVILFLSPSLMSHRRCADKPNNNLENTNKH